MINFIKQHKIAFIIFCVSLAFHLLVFGLMMFHYGPGSFYFDNDGQSLAGNNDVQYYVLIARNFVDHQVYSSFIDAPFQSTAYKTPLLPFYFVPFIYLFGFSSIWLAMLILNIILSFIPVVSYLLAKLFVSQRKALIVGLIIALEPLLVFMSNFVGGDALLVLLFLTSLYNLILFWQQDKKKNLYYSALFLGLAAMAKPVATYLAILFIILVLFKLFFKKDQFKKLVAPLIIFIIIFIAIIFPWLFRNYLVFGVWDFSAVVSHNFYAYYTDSIPLENEEDVYYSPEDRDPTRSLKYQRQLLNIAFDRIKAQPVVYFKNHLLGTARSFFASDFQSFYYYGYEKLLPFNYNPAHDVNLSQEVLRGNYIGVLKFVFSSENFGYLSRYIIFSLFYLLVIYGWWKAFRKDKKTFVIFSFFLLFIFYFVFGPGPYVDPKYRLPILPLLFIIFFYGLSKNKIKSGNNQRIVIASDIFPPDIGGPATYSKKLAEELISRGWQVKLICYSDKKQDDKAIRIIRSKIKGWHHFKYFWRLFFLSFGKDVIYAMGPVSAGLPAMWVAKILNKKFVVKVVGDYAWEQARNLKVTDIGIDDFQNQKFDGKIEKLKKIESQVCQSADKVITPSNYLKNIVMGWGVPEEKVQVIYNAFSGEFKNEINKKENQIVSVGRLVPWKGFDTLIDAFSELLDDSHNFELVIYGEGPQENKLKEKINELQLNNRINIIAVPHNILINALRESTIFILNTGYEGLPHTILEAMSAGVPVITTNVCGNPEVITDNENGLLVEYNNKEQLKQAILKLYNDQELRQKFINNSKEVLKKFKYEDMISNTEKLLREI